MSASSSRILKLFGPAYALLSHGQCFQISSPNLQWLTSFDSRKLYPLFGWPSSHVTPNLSYDWEGGRKRMAQTINGMGKKMIIRTMLFGWMDEVANMNRQAAG